MGHFYGTVLDSYGLWVTHNLINAELLWLKKQNTKNTQKLAGNLDMTENQIET